MAPELFLDDGIPSIESDIYSFGCVLYELYTGSTLFNNDSLEELINNILYSEIDFSNIDKSENDFISLLSGLLY